MSATRTLTIDLPEEDALRIDRIVAGGLYPTAQRFLAEAARQLADAAEDEQVAPGCEPPESFFERGAETLRRVASGLEPVFTLDEVRANLAAARLARHPKIFGLE